MPSSPAVPKVRLGPRFAAVNDVDRDVEEALGLEPEQELEQEPKASEKGVDEEIDELLSETDELEQEQEQGRPSGGPKDNGEWGCRWDDCWREQDTQDALVEHLQSEHIGQGRESYVCLWEHCPRKGQKQATRHSLITHCRAHTGERPYTCTEFDCRKTFTRSDALTKHLRSLHNITPDIPPRKKGKDWSATNPPPDSSPPTSPYLMTKGDDREKDVDEVIAEVMPLSPPTTTTAPLPEAASSSAPPLPAAAPPPTKPATKAKPRRSRAKTQKDKNVSTHASTSKSDTRIRNFPLPLPSTSSFYNTGMGELNTDEDLLSVLPRLFDRQTFWQGSDDDEPALDLVRDVRARERQGPPYGVEEEEYDSLDEMIPPVSSVRVVGETGHPDGSDSVVPVMSRSRHQARFMMAKAKVMLLAEENEMRRKELEATMREEIELDNQLAKRTRHTTK